MLIELEQCSMQKQNNKFFSDAFWQVASGLDVN
jgi:hypothetical protein